MKRILFTSLTLPILILSILSSVVAQPAGAITPIEGFEDDFIAGRQVPDLVDASLSTPFSGINEKWPAASGFLTLRDRDISVPSGEGGGFQPIGNVILDFTDGMGSFVTFRFSAGGLVISPGSTITFDVVAYGGDGGSLLKFVSSDEVNFVQVGDGSSAERRYSFDLATGGTEAFFRLQVGTAAGIFEGVHVDNFVANIKTVSTTITSTVTKTTSTTTTTTLTSTATTTLSTTLTSATTITSVERVTEPSTYAWAVGATATTIALAAVLVLRKRKV